MRIAVLADIHGNIYALQSVMEDIYRNNIDEVIFLGDLVLNGLYPKECFQLLHELKPTVLIKGNTDGWFDELDENWLLQENKDSGIFNRYKFLIDHLTKEEINQIKKFSLPQMVIRDSVGIFCCHGSPRSYSEKVLENMSDEDLSMTINDLNAEVVLVAHTHIRMDINRLGKRLVNPGAVGYSFDGDTRAAYGILEVIHNKILYEQRNIEYDRNRYIQDLAQSNTGFSDNVIELVSKGVVPKSFR